MSLADKIRDAEVEEGKPTPKRVIRIICGIKRIKHKKRR